MAGRGRGRGRGAGSTNKALVEQLGLQKNELIKEPIVEPPETFPSLQFRPVKTADERPLDRSYMVVVKKELKEYLQNSEYNVILDTKKPDIERYSDRFHCLNNKPQLELSRSRYPKELWGSRRPSKAVTKRKSRVASNVVGKKKRPRNERDLKEKLEELEKKEVSGDEEKKEDEETEEVLEEVEEDGDYEMDEGTDYINSYFDNGEGYIEEDGDALEEGGVF